MKLNNIFKILWILSTKLLIINEDNTWLIGRAIFEHRGHTDEFSSSLYNNVRISADDTPLSNPVVLFSRSMGHIW